jgi:hypothetical protein
MKMMIALLMEAVQTAETLLNSHQYRYNRYNPEDSHLHSHCRENLESYLMPQSIVIPKLQITTKQG